MVKSYQRQRSSIITRSVSNVTMVESTFGTENYKYNDIGADDFFGSSGQGDMHGHGSGK